MADYTVVPEVKTDDPAHVEAMVAKAEGRSPDEPLLAGKYKSEEDLVKGYVELLKKQGGSLEEQYKSLESQFGKAAQAPESVEPQPSTEPETPAVPDKPKEIQQVTSVLDKAGLNSEEVMTFYAETGTLKPEHYEALAEKVGLDKMVVDQYIEGQKAIMDRAIQTVYTAAGGETQYNTMIQWAVSGMTQPEIEAFNATLAEGNMSKVVLAVQGLKSQYESKVGRSTLSEPNLVSGDAGGVFDTGYRSSAELHRDMADPRYKRDPAFQDQVIRKLARSKNL
jgi:hypothetical protein